MWDYSWEKHISFEAHGQDVAYIHDTCNISKPALVDLLLVGRLAFHILGIIIPTDFHIFQRGRYTNQIWLNASSQIMLEPPKKMAIVH